MAGNALAQNLVSRRGLEKVGFSVTAEDQIQVSDSSRLLRLTRTAYVELPRMPRATNSAGFPGAAQLANTATPRAEAGSTAANAWKPPLPPLCQRHSGDCPSLINQASRSL